MVMLVMLMVLIVLLMVVKEETANDVKKAVTAAVAPRHVGAEISLTVEDSWWVLLRITR